MKFISKDFQFVTVFKTENLLIILYIAYPSLERAYLSINIFILYGHI